MDASENDGYWPVGAASTTAPVWQEWRQLWLAGQRPERPEVGRGTGQSIVKVSLRDGYEPVQVPYCLASAHAKAMCAAALSGLHLQGALQPMDDMPPQRALVVGLGGGSIPLWLHHTFPEGKIVVDAVEIDPAVVAVATDALGFPARAVRPCPAGDAVAAAADALSGAGGESLRSYTLGGEAFVEALAARDPQGYRYSMVFVDAVDDRGRVPAVLVDPDGPFLRGLRQLLEPKAVLSFNTLVGMTGFGRSGGPKELDKMCRAIYGAACLDSGEAYQVRTPNDESSGNQIYTFLRAGRVGARERPLRDDLESACKDIQADFPPDALASPLRFDLAYRVARKSTRQWRPEEGPRQGPLRVDEPGQLTMWMLMMASFIYLKESQQSMGN